MSKKQGLFRSPRQIALGVYVLLLVVSHFYQPLSVNTGEPNAAVADRLETHITTLDDNGDPIADQSLRMVYRRWASDSDSDNIPVLLMHGAPGSGGNFNALGPLVAADGRDVYAPDLVGFGESDMGPNISYRVQARYMFEYLDEMGVDRVHLVGWSNGGGVGIRMADLDPDRIASLTMLASVGAQETEGSGSYFFEHVKYGVGFAWIGYLPELIPHFGILGTPEMRTGWLWSFWDSDQRELTRIMGTMETPTLILQGRHDFLVMSWAAERHHEIISSSKLIMLDASHFLPTEQKEETADYLATFFDRHEEPGVEPETGYLNLAPVKERSGFDGLLHLVAGWVLQVPWWVQLLVIVVMVRYCKLIGLAMVMIMTAMMSVDFGVAILGMMAGRSWWLLRSHRIDRPFTAMGWVRGVAYILAVFIAGLSGGGITVWLTERFGLVGFAVGYAMFVGLLSAMRMLVTWEGRQRIKGEINRITCHEYWLTGLVYLPMLWWGLKRMIARRWLIELTSVNPGYSHDGGIMCESKMDINRKLGDGRVDDEAVLHCVLIEENEDLQLRTKLAIEAIRNDAKLGGLPVYCKPDRGERGRAVAMVKTEEDLIAYCQDSEEAFVIQQRHSGAMEVGVLWVRHLESITDASYEGQSGFIYAITLKEFPVLIGDGKRSIRRLILRHKRYRAQSRMFFDQMRDQLSVIPENGQEVSLGAMGDHSQGAKFTDGAHLITDALTERIGEIVDRFVDEQGRGFDIGRFDLRCDSLEQLAKGEGFGIVELNGLTSEPTNLYDPSRSIFWAWDMLCGYWMHAERIAAVRLETRTGEMVDGETWKKIRGALVRVMFT